MSSRHQNDSPSVLRKLDALWKLSSNCRKIQKSKQKLYLPEDKWLIFLLKSSRIFKKKWPTTESWSPQTRGRTGLQEVEVKALPPPASAAGTAFPTSRTGSARWPARSDRRDKKKKSLLVKTTFANIWETEAKPVFTIVIPKLQMSDLTL